MNRYDYARYFGALLVALGGGVLALTYPPPLDLGAQAVALVAAGVADVLAGTENGLRERVGPHRLFGAGNVLLGASLVVGELGSLGADGELVYVAVSALAGASLAVVGLSYVFWPHHFGLGPDGYPLD